MTALAGPATGSQYQPGVAAAQPNVCLAAAALGDGVHAGSAGGTDASGGQAAPLPFTVRIDRTPPGARVVAPVGSVVDARPVVELDVGDATSGVKGAAAQIDGTAVALELNGARVSGRSAAALAYGGHTLTWAVVDAAGNRTDGSARFDVAERRRRRSARPQPPSGAVLGAGRRC